MAELTMYGEISRETAGYAAKRLLRRNKAMIYTERFGQGHVLPKNSGQIMKFRRYLALALAVAPLAEGITPTGQKLRTEDVVVRLEQYGDSVGLTDVIKDTHHDPVLKESLNLCNDQIRETIETIRFSVLKSGTNVFYGGSGVTSRAYVAGGPSDAHLKLIERSLLRNRAEKITSVIKATQLIATEPVPEGFYTLGHTDLKPDIEALDDYTPVHKYSNSSKALEGEIGQACGMRFLLSQLYTPWLLAASSAGSQSTFLSGGVATAGYADVYPLIVLAKDAYGIVRLQGENAVTPIVLNPDKPDKSDPLAQRGYVAWKMWQACVILSQFWMARYEVACDADADV